MHAVFVRELHVSFVLVHEADLRCMGIVQFDDCRNNFALHAVVLLLSGTLLQVVFSVDFALHVPAYFRASLSKILF